MKNTASRAEKSSSRTITFCGRTGKLPFEFPKRQESQKANK